MQRLPIVPVFAGLVAATVGLLALSLVLGTTDFGPAAVWHALSSREPSLARDVVLDLRLPRALTALAVGGLLGLAGALLQVLLRNPLADPYVLGVSGGASVAALLALMLGFSAVSVDVAAAAGALAACALVFALAQGP
ncbi:MAG TPA: iron chelate uptake ABC transporter family permease subunit, partial [Steroidobacteraceae bacterium]|nr:iron chelate uptake ABC transporter family permease subunit [Steroidobacteraceae bacterium]